VKSSLKNSTSDKPQANPFSPPRPSAQSLLSTPTHNKHVTSKTAPSTAVTNHPVKYLSKPTIIRASGASSETATPFSTETSDNQQHCYRNFSGAWDEPSKSSSTAIRPLHSYTNPDTYSSNYQKIAEEIASSDNGGNYYDDPPNEDFVNTETMSSPPMPEMSPPPPPQDGAFMENTFRSDAFFDVDKRDSGSGGSGTQLVRMRFVI